MDVEVCSYDWKWLAVFENENNNFKYVLTPRIHRQLRYNTTPGTKRGQSILNKTVSKCAPYLVDQFYYYFLIKKQIQLRTTTIINTNGQQNMATQTTHDTIFNTTCECVYTVHTCQQIKLGISVLIGDRILEREAKRIAAMLRLTQYNKFTTLNCSMNAKLQCII